MSKLKTFMKRSPSHTNLSILACDHNYNTAPSPLHNSDNDLDAAQSPQHTSLPTNLDEGTNILTWTIPLTLAPITRLPVSVTSYTHLCCKIRHHSFRMRQLLLQIHDKGVCKLSEYLISKSETLPMSAKQAAIEAIVANLRYERKRMLQTIRTFLLLVSNRSVDDGVWKCPMFRNSHLAQEDFKLKHVILLESLLGVHQAASALKPIVSKKSAIGSIIDAVDCEGILHQLYECLTISETVIHFNLFDTQRSTPIALNSGKANQPLKTSVVRLAHTSQE